jgi:hypothetical protein
VSSESGAGQLSYALTEPSCLRNINTFKKLLTIRDIIVLTLTFWKDSQMPGELANLEFTKPPAESGFCFCGSSNVNRAQKEGPSDRDESAADMQLVYELADVVRTKEDHAREMEARGQDLAQRALDELNLARMRVRSAEITHAKTEERVKEAMAKVDEFERALMDTEARIGSAEAQLAAAILRAETAEARTAEAEEALLSLAGAIRTGLLKMRGKDLNNSAVAGLLQRGFELRGLRSSSHRHVIPMKAWIRDDSRQITHWIKARPRSSDTALLPSSPGLTRRSR